MDQVNEYITKLITAREIAVTQRRNAANSLSRPYERGQAEDMKQAFVAVQETIEAIDRALADERHIAQKEGLL